MKGNCRSKVTIRGYFRNNILLTDFELSIRNSMSPSFLEFKLKTNLDYFKKPLMPSMFGVFPVAKIHLRVK